MVDTTVPLLKIPPSYIYNQFADDAALQAYASSFNAYAQEYLDWFNTVCLGDYRSTYLTGALLDWIANGIYGLRRVPLSTSKIKRIGPYNTAPFNTIPFAGMITNDNSATSTMNDDIFKRTMTWNLYEGDGFEFTTTWLKRRIMRFMVGPNGNDGPFTHTYNVSVAWTSSRTAFITMTLLESQMAMFATLNLCITNGVLNLPLGYNFTLSAVPSGDLKNDFGWDIS